MITNELKALVKDEAEKLKKYATSEELGKLDFKTSSPWFGTRCPYGQMTGSCYSLRADELLKKCAYVYSQYLRHYSKTRNKLFAKGHYRMMYSPIEFYVAQDGAKSKDLIDFLKGKSKTLNL